MLLNLNGAAPRFFYGAGSMTSPFLHHPQGT
jgi:hypothetical protein